MNPPLEKKPNFEARIARSNGCWRWLASFNRKGYGVFSWGKDKRTGAHRAAWVFYHGAIPDGMHVLHTCDNPGCVNPDHLFLGDNAANVADKVSKGRCASMMGETNPMWNNHAAAARGESAPCVKLKEEQVNDIRRKYMRGASQNALAREYRMSQCAIWSIVNRKTWTHLPQPDLFDGDEGEAA